MTKYHCKLCPTEIKSDRVYCDKCYLEVKLKGKETDHHKELGDMYER